MTRLAWGEGPPMYDQGVDHGVLYLDGTAVPWNGLVSVEEVATGEVDVDHYFEGNRVHISHEIGDFQAKISAYTYPDVFSEYNGYSDVEEYRRFGFAYRTRHGLDGYKLHLVYNVLVNDDQRSWSTMSARTDPSLFAWDIHAAPEPVPGARPAARLMLESPRDPSVLKGLEDILYGTETTEPRLPDPAEVVELYEAATLLRIVYHGDGSYSASGPDHMVQELEDGRFALSAPTVFFLSHDIFAVNSY